MSSGFLGQGASGRVFKYSSATYGVPIARKIMTRKVAFDNEVSKFQMCKACVTDPFSEFVIGYFGNFVKGKDTYFLDMELAVTDLHDVAVSEDGARTGYPQFADGTVFDTVVRNTLSGL